MTIDYHEPAAELSPEVRDIHRAIASLIEELEAVDWYHQRVDICDDEGLRAILAHNRDEEVEHAAMTLEWIRRKMPIFDQELRTYLFKSEAIHTVESGEHGGGEPGSRGDDLGLGSFRKEG